MSSTGKQEADQVRAEEEVWNAISAFEQILEAMPEDRASLEALAHAYEQIGDHTRACNYLVRLVRVLVECREHDEAAQLLPKLRKFAPSDAGAADLVKTIEDLNGARDRQEEEALGPLSASADAGMHDELLSAGFSMADELAVAWKLMESGELPQDEYASVVQDLTEMSARENAGTASVLHMLEFRGARNLERIMRLVSQECGTPIISLASFAIQPETAALLPMDYMLRRGILVFDVMGNHALAVVMNPYNKQLQADAATLIGRDCHFYMALPSEFDRAMVKIRDMTKGVP